MIGNLRYYLNDQVRQSEFKLDKKIHSGQLAVCSQAINKQDWELSSNTMPGKANQTTSQPKYVIPKETLGIHIP